MDTILKPVAHNEKSYNVALLHQVLRAFGLPVSKTEVAQGRAGKDTTKQARALLVKLKVPVGKTTVLSDTAALAITKALKEKNLIIAARSFTVIGSVKLPNGVVKKRQRLLAFDLDLRGVEIYRTVKNLDEIRENGGFEFLGHAVSDNQGNYRITFYDWQYSRAERKKADVVVYAVEGETVTGLSRMINSEDYSDKGLVQNLDVIIMQRDRRTEYEQLMGELNAFLKESETSLARIAGSSDQLTFTAGELDIDAARINIAARAELLAEQDRKRLSHELLYGIGRQNINLSCAVLYKKSGEELRKAILKSVDERIIREFSEREVTVFIQAVNDSCAKHVLDNGQADGKNTLGAMLANALPEKKHRLSFLNALSNFEGNDFHSFWNEHLPSQPEFKDNPKLVSRLLVTQQLTLLTGNHQALVNELQNREEITSMLHLFDFDKDDWITFIKKTGVPDFIEGRNEQEKIDRYAGLMQSLLNAAFPTGRIQKMVEKEQLSIKNEKILKSFKDFLSKTPDFDFATSRIHDFEKEIRASAGQDFDEVNSELMKIQRVFQVSTSPEVMSALVKNNLHSAYAIANIPEKSFIRTYGEALGGEQAAFAVHQRAMHQATKAEMAAMHLMDYSHGITPEYAMGTAESKTAMAILKNNVPNYAELFGSPDLCECSDCRSVHSAAAYLVDLLRFLWRGEPNSDDKSPLDILATRRPDLLYLPLTCENTNTIIPYIDMVNEVMEYYTANDSLADFKGYDTGKTLAEELRANPQNFNLEAYRKLKDAKYPFTLPYHQPLDTIRNYSDHLKVSRYEVMKAMNPVPDAATQRAIEAESLGISQEEYIVMTKEDFHGTNEDTTSLFNYFGYDNADDFANMQNETDADGNPKGIMALLGRTGLKYTELIELVKTQFINPSQEAFDFLRKDLSLCGNRGQYDLCQAQTDEKRERLTPLQTRT